ncbi:MAG: phenylacetate--CoA ligase family protein, partial [Gemmatimonadales bacterium]
ADLPELVESFARVLDIAGLRPGDLVHNSFPYLGVHPIGHMFGHALRERGLGNIFAGSGANTPTDAQVQMLFDLRPTVWMGIGSYLNHLGHRAEALGYDPATSSIRRTISSAEPLSPAKRARMQDVWGAELFDCYGMTECSMMGAECARHDGLHIWTDMFAVEILDPDGQPLPAGEVGDVIVTPFHSASAIPFLRWASGDRGALEPDCDCRYAVFPRLKLTDRTVGFTKVRGVNLNNSEVEDKLLTLPAVADYMVTVATVDMVDRLGIEIEIRDLSDSQVVIDLVRRKIGTAFEVRPDVSVLERGTIAARLEADVKQVRVRDLRSQ